MTYTPPHLSENTAFVARPEIIESPNTVFIVKEAWGQPGANASLLEIAQSLYASSGVKDFFVEGVFDPMTADHIREIGKSIPDKKAAFTRGEIKPVEYLALSSDGQFNIHPADKEDLYNDNYGAYLATVQMEKDAKKALGIMQKVLKRFRQNRFSKDWLTIYDLRIKRLIGKNLDMGTYLKTLIAFADNYKIDLAGQDKIQLVRKLLDEEEQMKKDHEKSQHEMKEIIGILLTRLSEKDPEEKLLIHVLTYQFTQEKKHPEQILNLDFNDLQAAYERGRKRLWAELNYAIKTISDGSGSQAYLSRFVIDVSAALGVDLKSYQLASQYMLTMQRLDTLVKQSDQLLRSVDHLAEIILRSHPRGNLLWHVFLFHRDLLLINKLFKSRLEFDDLKHVEKIRSAFTFGRTMEKLKLFQCEEAELRKLTEFSDMWDRGLDRAIRFYDYAELRRTFMKNSLKKFFSNEDHRVAAIFLGGFHSNALQRDLCREDICSSTLITPHISGNISPVDIYKQIMLRQKS